MSVYESNLPFTQLQCESCGAIRPAGERCPRCGSSRIYDDPHVDRRRRMVERARPLLDRAATGAAPIAPKEVFDALGAWPGQLLTAVQRVSEGTEEEASSRLRAALTSFRRIADRVGASPRKKDDPVWTTIAGILGALRVVIDSYLAALTTTSPQEAKAHAAEAQRQLDAAGAIAGNLTANAADEHGFWNGVMLGAVGGWLWGHKG